MPHFEQCSDSITRFVQKVAGMLRHKAFAILMMAMVIPAITNAQTVHYTKSSDSSDISSFCMGGNLRVFYKDTGEFAQKITGGCLDTSTLDADRAFYVVFTEGTRWLLGLPNEPAGSFPGEPDGIDACNDTEDYGECLKSITNAQSSVPPVSPEGYWTVANGQWGEHTATVGEYTIGTNTITASVGSIAWASNMGAGYIKDIIEKGLMDFSVSALVILGIVMGIIVAFLVFYWGFWKLVNQTGIGGRLAGTGWGWVARADRWSFRHSKAYKRMMDDK